MILSYAFVKNSQVTLSHIEDGLICKYGKTDETSWFPVFHPEKESIYLVSNRSGQFDIWEIRNFQTEPEWIQLTNDKDPEEYPVISKNGKELLFQRRTGDNYDLYLMNLETNHTQKLTANPSLDCMASFAPDGNHIVYITKSDEKDIQYPARMNIRTGEISPLPAFNEKRPQGACYFPLELK